MLRILIILDLGMRKRTTVLKSLRQCQIWGSSNGLESAKEKFVFIKSEPETLVSKERRNREEYFLNL